MGSRFPLLNIQVAWEFGDSGDYHQEKPKHFKRSWKCCRLGFQYECLCKETRKEGGFASILLKSHLPYFKLCNQIRTLGNIGRYFVVYSIYIFFFFKGVFFLLFLFLITKS